jgi:hypothetical protein
MKKLYQLCLKIAQWFYNTKVNAISFLIILVLQTTWLVYYIDQSVKNSNMLYYMTTQSDLLKQEEKFNEHPEMVWHTDKEKFMFLCHSSFMTDFVSHEPIITQETVKKACVFVEELPQTMLK